MSEKIDMLIIKKIRREDVEVPDSYSKKVDETLQQLPDHAVKTRRRAKVRFAVAAAVCMCFVLSGTIFAASNYVRERMQAMTESEISDMISDLQNSPANIDSYSREFSEEEEERIGQLLPEYQTMGRFPEDDLKVVESQEMITADTLAFVAEDSKFILPERALTDEELLQIIDFRCKRDYSLQIKEEATEATEDVAAAVDVCAEAAAKTQAMEIIRILYDVDTTDFKTTRNDAVDTEYWLEFTSQEQDKYSVIYDLTTERITEVEYSIGEHVQTEAVVVNVEQYKQMGESLLEKVRKLDSTETVTEAYCTYQALEDGRVNRGRISYIYKLQSGECYVVKYNLHVRNITDCLVISYADYKQVLDNTVGQMAERVKIVIPMNN